MAPLRLSGLALLALPLAVTGVRDTAHEQGNLTVALVAADGEVEVAEDAAEASGSVLLNEGMLSHLGGVSKFLRNYAIIDQNYLKSCYNKKKGKSDPEYTCEEGQNSHSCWAVTRSAAKAWACGTDSPCYRAAKNYLTTGKGCTTGGYYTSSLPKRMRVAFEGDLESDAAEFYGSVERAIENDQALVLAMAASRDGCPAPGSPVMHFVTVVGVVPWSVGSTKTPTLVVFDPWDSSAEAWKGTYRLNETQDTSSSPKKVKPLGTNNHPNIVAAPVISKEGRIYLGGPLNFAKGEACIMEVLGVNPSNGKGC